MSLLVIQTLTFQSLRVTSRTTRFNIQTFCMVITLHLCVLYGSQNKQQYLPCTSLASLVFIIEVASVYSAVRAEYLNNTDTYHNNVTNLIHLHFHNHFNVSQSSTCFGRQASIFRRNYISSFGRQASIFRRNYISSFGRQASIFRRNCISTFRRQASILRKNYISSFGRQASIFRRNYIRVSGVKRPSSGGTTLAVSGVKRTSSGGTTSAVFSVSCVHF
jgi:hypothetical protein